jgi:hypothetical protein
MMEFFKNLSRILLIPPAITLFYDLIHEFFVNNRFLLRPLRQWWVEMSPGTIEGFKSFMSSVFSPTFADKMMTLPAPVVLIVPPLIFYFIYRIIFLLQGGKTGGGSGFVYKSRH